MSATVVRIVGPSYCGSTVLGCAMNTGKGVFFGSEIYRYLVDWRDAENEGRFPNCDFCGPSCEYWSDDLRAELAASRVDRVSRVYHALLRRHPEITMLVDGSKSVPGPDDATPDFVVSPRKHPIRLVASHIYNRRQRFGIDADGLDEVGDTLERSLEDFESVINAAAGYFLRHYHTIASEWPAAHIFRADEAHEHSFRAFRRLEEHLGVPDRTFDPAQFSQHPAHTIGGNRQPIWMTKRASGQITPTNPRTDYYDASGGTGDWKLDDKYQFVFRPATLEMIAANTKYRALCELLAYEPTTAVSAVDTPAQ